VAIPAEMNFDESVDAALELETALEEMVEVTQMLNEARERLAFMDNDKKLKIMAGL
jgi:negative regulator of sigma E activity